MPKSCDEKSSAKRPHQLSQCRVRARVECTMTRVEQSSIEVGQFTLGWQIIPTGRPGFKQWVRRSSKLGPLAPTKESNNDAAVLHTDCGVIPPYQSHQKANTALTSSPAEARACSRISAACLFACSNRSFEVQPSEPMPMRSLMFSTSPSASRSKSSKESILNNLT